MKRSLFGRWQCHPAGATCCVLALLILPGLDLAGGRTAATSAPGNVAPTVGRISESADDALSRGDGPARITELVQAALALQPDEPEKVERLLKEALDLGKAETEHPLEIAQALNDAGELLFRRVRPVLNREFFTAALAIRERHAPESLLVAESLMGVSEFLEREEAHEMLQHALALRKRLAPGSEELILAIGKLGQNRRGAEEFEAAERYSREALLLAESVAPRSTLHANAIHELGMLAQRRLDWATARQRYAEALEIKKESAPGSSTLAATLNNLGIASFELGDLEAAQDYYEQTRVIDESLSPGSLFLASTYMNLGNVARFQSDFQAARDYYRLTLKIQEQLVPDSGLVGGTLINVAGMLKALGDFEAARSTYERALTLFNPDGGTATPAALGGLAELDEKEGKLEDAEKRLRRLIAMRRKLELEPAVAMTSLAGILISLDRLDEAEEHLLASRATLEETAPESMDMADVCWQLARLERRRGRLEPALRHAGRSLALLEASHGPDGPRTVSAQLQVARLTAEAGRSREAFEMALAAERLAIEHLRSTVRYLPERQGLLLRDVASSGRDLILTLAVDSGEPPAVRAAWDVVRRDRAVVLDEMARRHLAAAVLGPGLDPLREQLDRSRARLARLLVQGPAGRDPGTYRQIVQDAAAQKERAEETLASASLTFRRERDNRQAGLDEIMRALPEATALVGFARYDRLELADATTGKAKPERAGVAHYVAFVAAGHGTEPVLVDLGPADAIDSTVTALRRAVDVEARAPGRSPLGERDYRRVGAALRRLIWTPIESHLQDSQQVFLVPDGALQLVNVAALPSGETGYLLDTGPRLHYLTTEQDVLPSHESGRAAGLLLVGGPAFDDPAGFDAATTTVPRIAQTGAPGEGGAAVFRGAHSTCADFRTLRFRDLPAARREIREIAAVWDAAFVETPPLRGPGDERRAPDALMLDGPAASEALFKATAGGRRVVHLATHGFFLGTACDSLLEVARTHSDPDTWLPASAENPLLLSGLALAGANRRDAAGPDAEDGILTAEEIASLDLRGTEWAVLSACDTGVGQVQEGEGVLGLRRAFRVAGARTIVMSLWPVDDESTREWMLALYAGRFGDGLSTVDAVHTASQTMLESRRRDGASTHPFFWAGFIAAGDWR